MVATRGSFYIFPVLLVEILKTVAGFINKKWGASRVHWLGCKVNGLALYHSTCSEPLFDIACHSGLSYMHGDSKLARGARW